MMQHLLSQCIRSHGVTILIEIKPIKQCIIHFSVFLLKDIYVSFGFLSNIFIGGGLINRVKKFNSIVRLTKINANCMETAQYPPLLAPCLFSTSLPSSYSHEGS